MEFCTNCGASVTGDFCSQCGTAVTGGTTQAVPAAEPAPPSKRKMGPLGWILIIVLGLFVLGTLVVVGGGLFVYQKVKHAGLDPELMKNQPALAVSKMIAAANPDVEVLNVDESRGLITFKEKSTGKTITLNFEDAKRGKIVFQEEGGKGETATMEFGADSGKLPDWIPQYPGAKAEGTFAMKGTEGAGGTFHFTTPDAADKVTEYYKEHLKQAGMEVNSTESGKGGSVIGTDEAGGRTVAVMISAESGSSSVNITFGTKR